MNKLLMIPLAVMFLITIIVSMTLDIKQEGSSDDYTYSRGQLNITGTSPEKGNVTIDEANSETFDIWTQNGIMIIMTVAIGIGIVAGVKILGSGISESSQMMIFNSIFFLGLWACLTIIARTIMFENAITDTMWFGLTMMFIVGLVMHVGNATDG